jgi:hypothetical protein
MHNWLKSPRVQVKMRRPMLGLVGIGGGVKVGRAVGRSESEVVKSEKLILAVGINRHNPIATTTRSNPIGK